VLNNNQIYKILINLNFIIMAEKIPVVIMVDPEKGAEIKPFAAELAKKPKQSLLETDALTTTGSITGTYQNGSLDGDGTID